MPSHEDTSTSNENNSASASKVFAIPELLEAILILLEPQDILISLRVARSWNKTIHGSRRMRQALFIEPEPVHAAWFAWVATEDVPEHDLNVFKVGKYAVARYSGEELLQRQLQDVSDPATSMCVNTRLNTMLHARGHWKHMTLDDRIERGEGLRLGRTKKKTLGHGRQMFLTQPPCKEVLLWINWGQPKRIFNEDGVRFWQVLEITEGASTTAYLPHMFMLAKGVIALTEAEEEMVEEELRKKEEGEKGDGVVGPRDGPEHREVSFVQTSGPSQVPGTHAMATVRRWIGW